MNRGMLRLVALVVAAVVLGVAALAVEHARQGDDGVEASPVSAAGSTSPTVTQGAASTPAVSDTTPPTTIVKVPLGRTLSVGSSGDDVTRMQQRLIDLHFDPGKADGQFGSGTQAAVWAFQKLVYGQRGPLIDGKVTPELWDRMQDPLLVEPRRPNASRTHMEVYLDIQVGVLFRDDQPILITHVSTGSGENWCKNGKCGLSITPSGVYRFYRKEKDWWEGYLGRMYNPVYFNYGVAVHGLSNVPNYPASHGCVRIPMHIAQYFPSLVSTGDQIYVFDGVKQPEEYGSPPPPFDSDDPNATTTTTAPPTTVAPSTTAPASTTPSTTRPASTTTTVKPHPTTTPAPTTTAAPPPPPTSAAGDAPTTT